MGFYLRFSCGQLCSSQEPEVRWAPVDLTTAADAGNGRSCSLHHRVAGYAEIQSLEDSVHVVSCSAFTTSASWEHGTEYCRRRQSHQPIGLFTSTYSSVLAKGNMSVTMRLRLKLTASFLALSSFASYEYENVSSGFLSPKQIKNIYFKGTSENQMSWCF